MEITGHKGLMMLAMWPVQTEMYCNVKCTPDFEDSVEKEECERSH